ncbi:MAG: DedA family protein [Rhodospirillaceae bacterium]|nr:DedA family protein [Rhodospirillaceae bacterium]MBT5455565.1 DedA family protein [Rhodospirillaceae bacterium]
MLQRTYDWVMSLSAKPNAVWALAAIAFIESSVFPIPPDVLLIPMVLAARTRWLKIALICTIASVLGGMLGYALGFYLYEGIGKPLLEFYGYADKFTQFQGRYNEWGAWIVFMAGVTPFPYKVITIASGVTHLDVTTFTVASILARGLRFFIVAALLWWIGDPIRAFIEKRLGLVFTVFVVLLIGGFVAIKYIA